MFIHFEMQEGDHVESMTICGGTPLYGAVTIQGSKNAALPVMAAAVLIPGVSVLKNCPRIADVDCMCKILSHIGCRIMRQGDEISIDASSLTDTCLPEKYVTGMRSSVMLMGPILARVGEVSLHYPGGCVIGDRPIDIHLKALEALGVYCEDRGEELYACAERMCGSRICLKFPSVGATENAIMAAVAAEGITIIENCAIEPEIRWLCEFLCRAGADISFENKDRTVIRIRGGCSLHSCRFEIPSDRIVAGTYLCACLAAGGEVLLQKSPADENTAMECVAERMGAKLRRTPDGLLISVKEELCSPGMIETASYPGFPTDLQSPLLPALAAAQGRSILQENIFNGRFRVVEELNRMGAGIQVTGNRAVIPGGRKLTGARVAAGELRGGAALVVAGLCAEGKTIVDNCFFIERGYEDICRDLRQLGAMAEKEYIDGPEKS